MPHDLKSLDKILLPYPAQQHATGIKDQAISRSIGGTSSKIHLAIVENTFARLKQFRGITTRY
ncbi:MAG: hypothetical protein RR487_05175, partial [Acinetobacter sp.]